MSKLILHSSLILLTLRTFGCTCDPDLKERDLIQKSEYAFIGQVINNIYKDEWTKKYMGGKGLKMDAMVRVIRVLKGEIMGDEVIVISSKSSECQINLIPGKRYLITGTNKLKKVDPPEFHMPPPFEIDSTYVQDTTKVEQPDIKDSDDWIMELQQEQLVIFTNVCQTRYKR